MSGGTNIGGLWLAPKGRPHRAVDRTASSAYKLICALTAAAHGEPVPATDEDGPLLDLYQIDFRKLPLAPAVRQLMRNIVLSAAPYDRSARATSIGDDTFGAMRQVHLNLPRYLPALTKQRPGAGRAALYHAYAHAYKQESCGLGGIGTGYVEYTAGDLHAYAWGGNRFRIVYDYYNARLYFAPLRYASWNLAGGQLQLVERPEPGSSHPNPFFWIVGIK